MFVTSLELDCHWRGIPFLAWKEASFPVQKWFWLSSVSFPSAPLGKIYRVITLASLPGNESSDYPWEKQQVSALIVDGEQQSNRSWLRIFHLVTPLSKFQLEGDSTGGWILFFRIFMKIPLSWGYRAWGIHWVSSENEMKCDKASPSWSLRRI